MQPHAPTRQRRDIQGLRAVAVLAVIAAHTLGAPAGGFVGVDVFFVISGYLITGLLLREVDRTGTISFRKFYERRAKRILPAAVVVIAATVVASLVLLGRSGGRDVAIDGLFSAFFAGNWRFAIDGVDYFAEGTPPSPLQHFWTLGVEEQFYLVWPWVMLAIVAVWGAHRMRRARVAIVAITGASFAWALVETATNPAFAYFSTFSRAWELGIGAILAFLPPLALSPLARRVIAWAGLVGIAVSLVVVADSSPLWPAPLGLLPVVSTAMVILAGADTSVPAPWILTNRVATYIGDVSYSLYLWHFPVAILLVAAMPAGTPTYIVVALAATFALSVLSFHLVENPARRAAWFRWRRRRIRGLTRAWLPTLASLAIVAVTGAAGFAVVNPLRTGADEETVAQTISPTTAPGSEIDCRGAGTALHPDECAGAEFDALIPAPDTLVDDIGDAYACYIDENAPLLTCAHGSESAATRVALVGDSHAAALLPALEPQLASLDWRLETFVGRGCTLMDPPDESTDCDAARPAINDALTSGDYDIVIATSTRRFATPKEKHASIIERIRDAGTRVIVVEDNPMPDEASIACTTRIGVGPGSECGTDTASALADPHTLAEAAEDVGAPVIDLTDVYCRDGFCDSIIGGVIVYRDAAGHITRSWARTLSQPLTREILEVEAES